MKKIFSPLFIILILWLTSVAIRIPQLNRPLSKHHEFTTALVLRIMYNWNEQGIVNLNFNPAVNYRGDANKFINNQSTENYDKHGNSYYLSYPPGAYLIPYLVMGGWIHPLDALSLQMFNLLLHLIECFLLWQIILLLTKNSIHQQKANLIALIAVIVHLFSPCLLWFHSNCYMVDMPAVTLFLWCVFLWLKFTTPDFNPKYFHFILLFLSSFIFSYTEYLGVAFAGTVFLYSVFRRKYFLLSSVTILGSVAALTLTLFQYTLISGWSDLVHFIQYRYGVRSGYEFESSISESIFLYFAEWMQVGWNYVTGFLPWLIALSVLFFVQRKHLSQIPLKKILFWLGVPVLIHHIVFLNASLYDFQAMKASPLIALLISFLFFVNEKKWFRFSLAASVAFSIFIFEIINSPGKVSLIDDDFVNYDEFAYQGDFIRKNSSPDEVVFLKWIDDEPQLIWYAKRNMRTIFNDDEAISFLQKHNLKHGVIFTFDRGQLIRLEQHIELSE
mgnify:CR=1 FL=1